MVHPAMPGEGVVKHDTVVARGYAKMTYPFQRLPAKGALLYMVFPCMCEKYPGCLSIRDALRRLSSGQRRVTAFCLFPMLIHVIVTLMLRKNKRSSGARLQKSPGRMTGRLLRLWVWELFPTRQKAKRIYAAPACDLASGSLFALLAIPTNLIIILKQ